MVFSILSAKEKIGVQFSRLILNEYNDIGLITVLNYYRLKYHKHRLPVIGDAFHALSIYI